MTLNGSERAVTDAATVADVAARRPTTEPDALREHIARHHVLDVVGPRWLDALLPGT